VGVAGGGTAAPTAGASAVEAVGLTFTYPGATRPAVEGVDVRVAGGEILGLLGPSGAGKSTTQMILCGRLRRWDGQAAVLGRDLRGWRARDNAAVGVSFEQPALFTKLTGRENLAFFGSLYPSTRDADALLTDLGLHDAADRRVGAYSKGMRVRLDLARALLHCPQVLFLDEPTAGLDPVSAERVRRLIRAEVERGAAVVLTTHDMVTADLLADRVSLVVEGQVVAEDTPRGLKLGHTAATVRVEHRTPAGVATREFPLRGLGDDPEFVALLRKGTVETIHTTEPSLADVFVRLTGQELV
jgi:fluoroquinolone transport system ATP-binding protein